MNLTAGQESFHLIEPLHRRPRRVVASVVILIVLIGLIVSFANPPSSSKGGQGGDITTGLKWMGQIIISFVAVLSSIVELTGVSVRDLFSSKAAKTNVEEFPFYVYQDYDKLLDYLFPDPKTPLLADRNIKYLPQISAETDAAFQNKGMVLIRGRSKTGKTREACELLKRWWFSGPTVLVVRSHVGLYPPYKIPENLPLRNLVIFFDDIDRYLEESSALKKLDETLRFFQEICHNRGEVRVIATVRQDEEFWDKLKFDSSQTPWNKFELVQLNPLSPEKALEVIDELSKMSGVAIEPELAKILAEKNNGTFLNLALAFRGWLSQNIRTITLVEVKTFEGTLKSTWRRRYEELAVSHPRVKPVYAAIDFLQSHNIPLRLGLINELATEMGMGKGFLSLLGWMDRLQNWFDMSPAFNWYRDPQQRRKGWILITFIGIATIYLLLYALMLFVPGNTQNWFFEELTKSFGFQIRCLLPLWILLIPFAFYSIMNILRNQAFRKADKTLQFLLDTEIPTRGIELRPYENQFDGNGSTNNWQALNYSGEISEKKFSSNASQMLINRYLELAEQLRTNGEFSPARKLAFLAQNVFPTHPAPLFMRGKIEVDEGNFSNGLELLTTSKNLYRRSSNLAYVQEHLALVYLFLGDYENAEQTADRALKEISSLLTARWILGLAQIKNGKILAGQKNCKIAESTNQPTPIEINNALKVIGAKQEEWFKHIVFFAAAKNKGIKWGGTIKRGVTLFLLILIVTVAFIAFMPTAESLITDGNSGLRITNALLIIFPGSPTLIGQRGYAYNSLEKYHEAIADYTEVIRIDSKAVYAYTNRGYAYNELGEYEKAIADYTEAIRIEPECAYAYNGRGNVYYYLGNYNEAIVNYTEAIHIDPKFAYAYNGRGYTYNRLGQYSEAISEYTEAIRIDPKYADAYIGRGNAHNRLGQYNEAIADYTEAIRIGPKYAYAYFARGDANYGIGKYEIAIADYTEAIRSKPERAKQCENISCYTATINLNINDANIYISRGDEYYDLGEYEKAIADYTEAIRIAPEAIYYNKRGNAYYHFSEYEKAITDYTEAIHIDPNYFYAYGNRGYAYYTLGDNEKSIADYTEGISINPEYAFAYGERGYIYIELGEYEKAISDYTNAIRFESDNATYYRNRGYIYAELGEYEKAVADYTEAILIDPNFANAYQKRGEAYQALGIQAEADTDFQKYKELTKQP